MWKYAKTYANSGIDAKILEKKLLEVCDDDNVICLFLFQKPLQASGESMAGILCLKSGPVIGHIWAEKRGYVPANNIPFRVKLENKSNRKISSIHVTLSQVRYMHNLKNDTIAVF